MSDRDDFSDDSGTVRDDFRAGRRAEQQPGMSGCAKIAIGCGAVSVVLFIIAAIGLYWAAQNVRQFGTDFAVAAMKTAVNEGQLPEDQEARILARIDEVGDKFKRGEITLEQITAILKKFSEGPLMPASMAIVVKRAYIDKSGLSEDEIAAADIAIQRFVAGSVDESIPAARRESVLDGISTRDAGNNRQFKQKLSDDELRKFIEDAAAAADEADVPADVPEINFADEFDKVVDEALGLAPAIAVPAAADSVPAATESVPAATESVPAATETVPAATQSGTELPGAETEPAAPTEATDPAESDSSS